MAFTDIHVNGAAVVYISKTGVTPVRLGITDEGVKLRFDVGFEPVMSDDLGSYIPTDMQFMGFLAQISGNFTRYDESLMEEVRARIPALNPGLMANADIGMLTITSGETYQVYIESSARTSMSSALQKPWRFPTCIPTDPMNLNLGTRYSKGSFGFTAYPNTGTLYTRA